MTSWTLLNGMDVTQYILNYATKSYLSKQRHLRYSEITAYVLYGLMSQIYVALFGRISFLLVRQLFEFPPAFRLIRETFLRFTSHNMLG